ncbi:MAG: peroxide stress protein YaaA [Cyclobacteriaceae bacterium]
MIAVVSPAKTLDFESKVEFEKSKARLFDKSKAILDEIKTHDADDLQNMMGISEDLAHLNVKRFQKFSGRHTSHNAKQSLFAFKGDVYLGLQAEDFTQEDVEFSQTHLRILSGLYGLLRPLDLIQPYRLEMGTKLNVDKAKNLYQYWGKDIAKVLRRDMLAQGDQVVLNLASVEYFKAVDLKALKANVVDVEFKDFNNGQYKIVSFFAKKARGMMARYMIKNRIQSVEELKGFDTDGYYFDESASSDSLLAFKRG